jgi:hypothetical protein
METNNKLLAEFLGYTQPHPEYPSSTYWYKEGRPPLAILSFDTDWNWLMEVVEKIESLGVVVEIRESVCYIETTPIDYYSELEETKIQATYNACVRFVKWYNEQK